MKNRFFLITPDNAEAGALETLPNTDGMEVMKADQLLQTNLRFSILDKIGITSEASLDLVKDRLDDLNKKNAIELLKDKFKFREILKNIYPDYTYSRIDFDQIKNLIVKKKSILKPLKGCFGTAVKTINEHSNIKEVVKEIELEMNKNASVLSEQVLSKNHFILEDYIEGEEYAVDMFFDYNGDPHIVNIYHHPLPAIDAYLHMIYYTSKEVFDNIYDQAIQFFKELNSILNVRNFLLHSEFKYTETGIFPIEINSMRYGGMGLGNMVYHAIGLNPYQCFKTGESPDWKRIWDKQENADSIFAFFIAYNGRNIDKKLFQPNIEKLKKEFTEVLLEEIFDYQNQLAFGVFCLKETTSNLNKLLNIEFNNYFKPIAQ